MDVNYVVNIDVEDLEKATRFYVEAFELRLGRKLGSAIQELLGGPAAIYLLQKDACAPPVAGRDLARTYERHWTPMHLDFVVVDIEAAVSRARRAGAHLEAPIAELQWGKLAVCADPFGHGFCFVQFLGAGYDVLVSESEPERGAL